MNNNISRSEGGIPPQAQQPEQVQNPPSSWRGWLFSPLRTVGGLVGQQFSRVSVSLQYEFLCGSLRQRDLSHFRQSGVVVSPEDLTAYVVQQIARGGRCDEAALAARDLLSKMETDTAHRLVCSMHPSLFLDPSGFVLRRLYLFSTQSSPEHFKRTLPIIELLVSQPVEPWQLEHCLACLGKEGGADLQRERGVFVCAVRALHLIGKEEEREGFFEELLSLFRKEPDRERILESIASTPKERRAAVVGCVVSLLGEIGRGNRALVVRCVSLIPIAELTEDFLRVVLWPFANQPLVSQKEKESRWEMLSCINLLPEGERATLLRLMVNVKGVVNGEKKLAIAHSLMLIPHRERNEEILQTLLTLFKVQFTGYGALSRTLGQVASEDRVSVVRATAEHAKDIYDSMVVSCIMLGIASTPEVCRTPWLLKQLVQLFAEAISSHAALLEAVRSASPEHVIYSVTVPKLLINCVKITLDGNERAGLVRLVSAVQKNHVASGDLEVLYALLQEFDQESVKSTIEIIDTLPPEARAEGFQYLFSQMGKVVSSEALMLAIWVAFSTSPQRRDNALTFALGDSPLQLVGEALRDLRLIDPRDRARYFSLFLSVKSQAPNMNAMQTILQRHLVIRGRAHLFLTGLLERESDPVKARGLSGRLLDPQVRAALAITDDHHSLALLAAAVYQLSDISQLGRLDNPYALVQKLVVWGEGHISGVLLEEELLGEEAFKWDPDALREVARPIQYTKQNLAPEVLITTPSGQRTTVFVTVFMRLRARFPGIQAAANRCVAEIDQQLGAPNLSPEERSTLESRKEELRAAVAGRRLRAVEVFLAKPTIQTLLHPRTNEVSFHTYQLYRMGQVLAQAGSEVQGEQFFTEQEEMLMAMAESIQFCRGGISEGLILFAQGVLGTGESRGEATDVEQRVQKAIERNVQKQMAGVFADFNFLGELGGQNPAEIAQGHHWTLFAKNLLSHMVGYEGHGNSVVFDLSTGVLSAELRERTTSSAQVAEAISIFFRHLKIEAVVEALKREINADLGKLPSEQKLGPTVLALYLSQSGSESCQPLFANGYLVDESEDGDFTELKITTKGVVALLLRSGLITNERSVGAPLCEDASEN